MAEAVRQDHLAMSELRCGLTVPLHAHTVAETGEIAREAEQLGYTDLWSTEISGVDGFTPLVYAAAHTESVRLGTAVVSSYTRGAACLAMSAAGCEQAAPGRFILGVGSATRTIVEDWNGMEFRAPVDSVRRTVRDVRAALAGERIQRGFRLDAAPGPHVPVYVAALRPRMLRLAGEAGDGVILNLRPPRAVPQVLAEVRRGAKRAGRDTAAIDVVARITVCSAGDGVLNRNAARRILAGYVSTPVYEAFLRWIGLGALLDAVVDSWRAGDREGALRAVSDELIDNVLVVGDAAHCRSRISEYREAGVSVPCLMPFSGEPEMEPRRAAIRRMVRELAPVAAQS